MRVLLSTALFYPSRLGGPANTLYWLAKALASRGIEVVVVTTDSHIEAMTVKVDMWCDVEGIKVRYCNSRKFSLMKELWHTWVEMKSADTVMLCDMFQRQVLAVAIMARLLGKRIIWSPRGELMGPALSGSSIKRWYICVVRKFFGRYATFHATSDEERSMIVEHIGKDVKVVTIPNYIELPLQLERENPQVQYFLFVGRVNRIKALDRLILGLAKSKLFIKSGFELIIAGPNQNDCQQELEILIADNNLEGYVKFIGGVFDKAKFQLYANARFTCLPSHSENFGNVVIESLSQGTPVIASTGTPWQKLNEANSGYWIDNSPESIGKCLDEALSLTDEAYGVMRHNARQLANSFDVTQNVGRWVEVI